MSYERGGARVSGRGKPWPMNMCLCMFLKSVVTLHEFFWSYVPFCSRPLPLPSSLLANWHDHKHLPTNKTDLLDCCLLSKINIVCCYSKAVFIQPINSEARRIHYSPSSRFCLYKLCLCIHWAWPDQRNRKAESYSWASSSYGEKWKRQCSHITRCTHNRFYC